MTAGYRAGEKAAQDFAARHHEQVEVGVALPGTPGEDVDWLDILRRDGVQAVRAGIDGAEPFTPPARDEPAAADGPSEDSLLELVERAKADRGAPFEPEALATLAAVRHASPAIYQRVVQGLKQAGVRMRDLDREVRRAGLRVIQGGPNTDGMQSTVEAGPYFVADNGMVAWRKETREGPVPQPLCNSAARIVAEEILDDGAERRTVLVLEEELPDKQRLPAVRIAAERFATMTWVTETWARRPSSSPDKANAITCASPSRF